MYQSGGNIPDTDAGWSWLSYYESQHPEGQTVLSYGLDSSDLNPIENLWATLKECSRNLF